MISKKKHMNQSLVGIPISSIVLDLFTYRFPFWETFYLKAVILNFDHKVPLLKKNNKTAHTNGVDCVFRKSSLDLLGFGK